VGDAIAGLDVQFDKFDAGYRLPPPTSKVTPTRSVFGSPCHHPRQGRAGAPAGYAMLESRPARPQALAGIAVTTNEHEQVTADPRIGCATMCTRYAPTIKGGAASSPTPDATKASNHSATAA